MVSGISFISGITLKERMLHSPLNPVDFLSKDFSDIRIQSGIYTPEHELENLINVYLDEGLRKGSGYLQRLYNNFLNLVNGEYNLRERIKNFAYKHRYELARIGIGGGIALGLMALAATRGYEIEYIGHISQHVSYPDIKIKLSEFFYPISNFFGQGTIEGNSKYLAWYIGQHLKINSPYYFVFGQFFSHLDKIGRGVYRGLKEVGRRLKKWRS